MNELCDAGCDTSVQNADGCTGWRLAESLERAEVLALDREELNLRAQQGRERRKREMTGAKSPMMTIKTKGVGLLQHESY